MDTIVEGNKDLLKKLTKFKNRIIDIHIESNNDNSMETMESIYKLKEVNDELKEALILLHTNNITLNKFNSESSLKNYNLIIDITTASIIKQNELIEKIRHNTVNKPTDKQGGVKNKLISTLADTKYKFIITIGLTVVIFWGMYLIAPEATTTVFSFFTNLLKKG